MKAWRVSFFVSEEVFVTSKAPYHVFDNENTALYLLPPVDEAIKLKEALDKAGYSVTWFEDEDHPIIDCEDRCRRLELPRTTDKLRLRSFLREYAEGA